MSRHTSPANAGMAILAVCGLLPLYGQAQEIESAPQDRNEREFVFDLSGGVGWTDNVTRAPVNAEEATFAAAGVRILFDEQRRRLEASLDASMQFYSYFEDEFEDDYRGGFTGSLNLALIPERFEWVVENDFGQIRVDPFDASTPENRENFNYFTTGPNLAIGLGSASVLRLFGRYSDSRYEDLNALDGNRRSAGLELSRQTSPGRGLSLNAVTERVEYEGTAVQDGIEFDRHQAFISLQGRGSRTELRLDLGYSVMDDGINESEGTVARIAMTRAVSSRSSVTLGGGRGFSDAGDWFREVQGRNGPDLEGARILATPDPFENTFGYFEWFFSFHRTGFGVGVDFNRERYETSPELDREMFTYSLFAEREVSPRMRIRVAGRYTEEEFRNVTFTDEEMQFSAAISTALGRSLTLELRGEHNERDSDASNTDFREKRVLLLLAWSARGNR